MMAAHAILIIIIVGQRSDREAGREMTKFSTHQLEGNLLEIGLGRRLHDELTRPRGAGEANLTNAYMAI